MNVRPVVIVALCGLHFACSEPIEAPVYVSEADAVFDVTDARISNGGCIAPDPPPPPGDIQLIPAFEAYLPQDGLDRAIQMVQDPLDDDHWFLVNQLVPMQRFGPDHDSPLNVLDITDKLYTGHDETGVVSLAFHPDFDEQRYAYVVYASQGGPSKFNSRLSRFVVQEDMTFDEESEVVLLEEPQPHGSHSMNQIDFGPDGLLYVSMGDGGNGKKVGQPFGQDPYSLRATMLRLDVDDPQAPLAYGIPADNPFVDEGGAPEVYAYGFRNVWRFSFDLETGDLWAGDVGQDSHEEVNLVVSGGNYGWPVMEGDLCYPANDLECDHTGMIDPVVAIDHVEAVSITCGYVYRGAEIPAMVGKLLYADYGSGSFWALDPDTGVVELQLETDLGIASFAQGRDRRLYVVGYSRKGVGGVYEIVENDAGPSSFPTKLSDTGCVDPEDPSLPAPGVVPYEVRVELWSDGADKERFVALPDDRRIDVSPTGDFHFPPGAVLIKHFKYDDLYHETRLLMLHENGGWAGYSYEWNDEQTDATLLGVGKTATLAGGQEWRYPTRGQCIRCHGEQSLRVLGPEVIQLQYPLGDEETHTQLESWFDQGFFVPDFETVEDLPATEAPPLEDAFGPATLEERAKSYLHANCANCHQPGAIGQGVIDLRWETPFHEMQLCGVEPENGNMWLGNDPLLLVPGDPERSLLYLRMKTLNKFRMPDIGSHVVHQEAVDLIGEWITDLQGCP